MPEKVPDEKANADKNVKGYDAQNPLMVPVQAENALIREEYVLH
ncbi:MAG: hypothetical protein Fur0023_19420 [Bacteroidia bacterium]